METKESRTIISPISFCVDDNRKKEVSGTPESMEVLRMGPYNPTYYQTDYMTGYEGRLRYDFEKKRMNVEMEDISYQKKLQYEKNAKALKIQYQNYLKMLSATVYKDTSGDIIFSILDHEKKTLMSKALLNVRNYNSIIYVSFYPQEKKVLEISWGDMDKKSLVFLYGQEGIEPNFFLKRLKRNGVLLLVSGRTEKQAANALLAYSFLNAEMIEIPNNLGWNKMSDGSWHHAKVNEKNMWEVMKDAGM